MDRPIINKERSPWFYLPLWFLTILGWDDLRFGFSKWALHFGQFELVLLPGLRK